MSTSNSRVADRLVSISKTSKHRKSAALLAASVAACAWAGTASAATVVWDGGTGGAGSAWLTDTNWFPNLSSGTADDGPDTGDLAEFNAAFAQHSTSSATIGINMNGTTNNGANNQAIGQILFSGGVINRTINNSSTTVGGVLTLNGISGTMLSNTTIGQSLTLTNGTQAMGVALANNGTFNVTNSGAFITVNSVISEVGGARSITKSGSGTLTLAGANTFTGTVNADAGTVSINTLTTAGLAQALGMGSGTVGIGSSGNDGVLVYTGAATTTDRAFSAGSAGGTLSHANNITYTGTISGGAFAKSGAGSLILSASGNITASSINVANGTLRLDNLTNNSDRIANSTNVALSGGTLQFDGERDVPTAEVAGQLQISGGGNTVRTTVAAGTTADASITFSSVAQSGGGTANFDLASGVVVTLASSTLTNGILGGWATVGSDFATTNGFSGNVEAYSSTVNNAPGTWVSTDNVRMNTSATMSSATTINSLQLADDAASPITLTADAALTVGTGGILSTAVSGHTIAGTGSVTSGGSDLYVHVATAGHTLNVDVPITGSIGLSTAGAGTTVINAANTFSGAARVNAGTLRFGTSGTLTSNDVIVSNGATLDLNGESKTIGSLAGAGAVTLGAGTLSAGNNNASTTYSGVISGTGSLTKVGTGTMSLRGVNTFTGSVNVGNTNGVDDGGVLSIDTDSRLGAAPGAVTANKINLYNGTLRLSGGVAPTTVVTSAGPAGVPGVLVNINRGVTLHSGNGKIDVPTGNYGEIAGIIASGGGGTSPLHKIGGGILDLRTSGNGNNTFTGGVIIDAGTLGVVKDSNFGAIPGAPDADAVQLNNGATIKWYSNSSVAGLNVNRGLTIGSGGGIIDYQHSSGVPLIDSPITSAAGNTLTKKGQNTLQANAAQPNMLGDFNVNQGRLNIHNNTAAGMGTIYLTAADTGQSTAPITNVAQLGIGGTNLGLTITNTQDIVLAPTGGINSFEVNGSTPTQNTLNLNGDISGTGGLTKGRVAGTTGTLALGGSNSFTGGVTVLLGTLQIGADANLGDAANDVTLGGSGAQATLKVTANVTSGGRDLITASGGGVVDTNTFNATFGNASGTANLVKNSAGTLTINHARVNNLTVNAGTVKMAAQADPTNASSAAGVSKTTGVTAAAGLIDVTNNKLITQTALGTWNGSAYTGVTGLVQAGRGSGAWDGANGIITSETDATSGVLTGLAVSSGAENFGLGATDTMVWAGQTINGSSTLVMYTWGGDADLNGELNGDDYFFIDSNAPANGSVFGYHQGDFDYNGTIDGDDYFVIDSNITFAQASAPFWFAAGGGGGGTGGLSAVPEPASIGLIGVAACGLLRRRRRA